jgi:hypothetical protein
MTSNKSARPLWLVRNEDTSDEPAWLAGRPTIKRVRGALRDGRCPPERMFDRFLEPEMRSVSRRYWTPLLVAVRAAEWFGDLGVRSVVDIGSGPGKFCVGAALAGDATFTGVEQRVRFVVAARSLARTFEVEDRVRFVCGTFGSSELTLPDADAYYLYNPFGENLFPRHDRLDADVDLSVSRYAREVSAMEDMLLQLPLGAYLLTYNGFGGRMPTSYDEIRADYELPNVLRLWRKTREEGEVPTFADALG